MEPPAEALADLTEVSPQIRAAVLFDATGTVAASTLDDEAGVALARAALDLVACAASVRPDATAIVSIEASLRGGGFFVVREGERLIAAVTEPAATSGLVRYDLATALRRSAPPAGKPKRRRRATESNAAA